MIRVLVWNEFLHEKISQDRAAAVYPNGIHQAIADFLGREDDITVSTATLDDPSCGITRERLKETDVLVWWGHMGHSRVPDEVAEMIYEEVNNGMGAVFLHSAHKSKPFMRLLGTSCSLIWHETDDLERIWTASPYHPIAQGLPAYFELPAEETYGEPFGIPTPEDIIFIGWFEGGEVFRSGCTWKRGNGKIFYFQPGHESYPTYKDPNIQRVILNAIRWTAPQYRVDDCMDCPNPPRAHQWK